MPRNSSETQPETWKEFTHKIRLVRLGLKVVPCLILEQSFGGRFSQSKLGQLLKKWKNDFLAIKAPENG